MKRELKVLIALSVMMVGLAGAMGPAAATQCDQYQESNQGVEAIQVGLSAGNPTIATSAFGDAWANSDHEVENEISLESNQDQDARRC